MLLCEGRISLQVQAYRQKASKIILLCEGRISLQVLASDKRPAKCCCYVKAPISLLAGTVLRQWDKTYTVRDALTTVSLIRLFVGEGGGGRGRGEGCKQTLNSLSDCVLCLMRIACARFPSDSAHCVSSKSVCRTTVFLFFDTVVLDAGRL